MRGLGEDSFEVPALILPVGRAPGPEGRPPGEASSSKSSCSKDLSRETQGLVSRLGGKSTLSESSGGLHGEGYEISPNLEELIMERHLG